MNRQEAFAHTTLHGCTMMSVALSSARLRHSRLCHVWRSCPVLAWQADPYESIRALQLQAGTAFGARLQARSADSLAMVHPNNLQLRFPKELVTLEGDVLQPHKKIHEFTVASATCYD